MKKNIYCFIVLLALNVLTMFCFADINEVVTDFTSQATASDLDNAQLSLIQVEQTLKNARLNLMNYETQLRSINVDDISQANRPKDKQDVLKLKIQNQIQLINLNEQRRETLKKIISVFGKQVTNERQNLNNLTAFAQKQQHLAEEQQIQQKIAALNTVQSKWLAQITALNALIYDKTKLISPDQYSVILEKIFIADENSNITQLKSNMLHINNSLNNTYSNISDNSTATELNQQRQTLTITLDELKQTQQILVKKIDLLNQRNGMLQQAQSADSNKQAMELQIQNFIEQYQHLLKNVNQTLAQATVQQDKTTAMLAKALARRQVLPGFNLHEWLMLGKGLKQLFALSAQLASTTCVDIITNLTQKTTLDQVKLSALLCFSLLGFGVIRHTCLRIQKNFLFSPKNFLHRLLVNALKIFVRYLWLIVLIISSVLFLNILNFPQPFVLLVLHLGNTVLIFSVAIMAARISFYETVSNYHGNDVRLYHRLFWLFSFGFVIRLFMILADYFNVPYEVQDLFDRTFMLFVFFIALMLLKASKVVPELIISSITLPQQYLIRTIKLLAVLIPLIILSNAIIGLIGYVALAWTMSKYEGMFLLVIAGYLILRGLLNDSLKYLVSSIVRQRSGWIMTEAFLKPIAIWLHILLFLACAYFLLYLYDLNNQPFILNYFNQVLFFPLLQFSTSTITLVTIFRATIIGILFFWATKWSREFCYRKLYKKIRDMGVRNSLSTFTQYGVCALGVIFTLKALQIDLTTLAVIAGGFAVGIGFGLRDLMNNFISGFMILIERTLRRGDTISIGDYEGKITHIGLRAMTLLGPDNREIIVPNSEAFSKTFINWNRVDHMVRCEMYLKAQWQEEPHQLQSEIEEVIQATEGVATKPFRAEALLIGMDNGLLEFEIRFCIDYSETESRTLMKSRVWCNLWERFSQLGISPSYITHRVIMAHDRLDSGELA